MTQRDCDDCRYGKLEGTEEPCKSCKATDEGFTNWRNREHPAMTNADRIRAMTDEELAEFLWNFNLADVSTVKMGEFGPHMFRYRLKEWLQMPVGEDDHA